MVVYMQRLLAVSCLLFVVGCVTDELAVYKESVVKKKDMKPFLGEYAVVEWPGDAKPKKVRVGQKEGKFHFAYTADEKKIQASFVLSKVPKSKKGLHLLSLYKQESSNNANVFFIGRVEKEKTHLWVVHSNLPVAKGELTFTNGKAKAGELKEFLAKRGDAFIAANEPLVTLVKQKGKGK